MGILFSVAAQEIVTLYGPKRLLHFPNRRMPHHLIDIAQSAQRGDIVQALMGTAGPCGIVGKQKRRLAWGGGSLDVKRIQRILAAAKDALWPFHVGGIPACTSR